jgi:hypothetical protein
VSDQVVQDVIEEVPGGLSDQSRNVSSSAADCRDCDETFAPGLASTRLRSSLHAVALYRPWQRHVIAAVNPSMPAVPFWHKTDRAGARTVASGVPVLPTLIQVCGRRTDQPSGPETEDKGCKFLSNPARDV